MDHLLAAIDLGSNSFRLSIGRVVQQNGNAQIYAVDRLKESVQLADGLGPDEILDKPAINRALKVLKRYGERLEGFDPNRVRAVATNTFRVARNVSQILPLAEAALGFPIEVISGQEEARLIYSGVANELPPSGHRRLVIDIGGGSTEVIIGKGHNPMRLSSLHTGCATATRKYFPGGVITAERMDRAELAARREFETISKAYRKLGWQQAYGSSGTAKGLMAILTEGGMSKKGITLSGLEALKRKLIADGKVVMENLPGVKPTRVPVLAGGLVIMMAAFRELKIDVMQQGEGALRVGVLYDLLGRDSEHDKRDETVHLFLKRYNVDINQANRVKELALKLFTSLDTDPDETPEIARSLAWASDLHEIGMSIAHAEYHRHSAYILEHADMPGFSKDDQALLSWMALGHHGKLSKLKPYRLTRTQWLALLSLRLAVLLCRRRETLPELPLSIQAPSGTNSIRVLSSKEWLSSHALSEYSLHNEEQEWKKTGFDFDLIET